MNKDRVEGLAHQAKGAVKAAAGKMTKDPALQAKGVAEKTLGKMQNGAGKLKDAARTGLKKSA
jgi:uncharacterized protein YjbJ (UPF0337 family)